jgi:hypothetical protein
VARYRYIPGYEEYTGIVEGDDTGCWLQLSEPIVLEPGDRVACRFFCKPVSTAK